MVMESVSESHILTDPVSSASCPKCGAALDVTGLAAFTAVQCPSCETEFQVPARLGAFLLLQVLGAGGMGGVYRARDEGLKREVAIKVMLKSLGDDPKFVETFQREAQAAAKLNHPNIAQIYSFGQAHGQPYIVMELVSGGSLDKMMAAQGPLDPAVVIHVGAQIADGLREAAEAGLVHGDVKPENILFDADKNAKLVDFGLAAMTCGPGNDVWGTPYYIAPEKVRRQKSDFRSDIYSLGATLYHAIAGVPPFEGPDATAVVKARFDGPPKALSEIRKDFPADVERLISRMLAVEPQMRYPTYGSLLGDMRSYLAKVGPVQLGGASKKIVFKGKNAKNTTGVNASTGVLSEIPPGMTPVENISDASEESAPVNVKKLAVIGVAAVALVALIVGGIFGVRSHLANKEQAESQAQLSNQQKSAKTSIAASLDEAKKTTEGVRASATEALGYAKDAADTVVAVLGEDSRAGMVPPEPEYQVPKEAPEEAAAPAPRAAAGAKGAAAPKANPAAAAKGKTAGAKTNEVAAAGATNAVAAAGATNEVAAAASNAAPEQVSSPFVDTAETPKESPVIGMVRGMYEVAYGVKGASVIADARFAEMETLAKTAEGLMKPEQVNALAKIDKTLRAKVDALKHTREIADVSRKMAQLKKTLAGVKNDTASLAEAKKQEAAEKERKAKEDALAEKKRQEQDAYKAKILAECERVAATEQANTALLKQLQFREALRALKDLTDGLETKEGLDALSLATERINRVKDFHAYLVEKVQGFKSARGWSVESADAKTLTVAGKKIQWIEVYASRLDIVAELVNGLVKDEQATKNLRLREKSKLMTNAALCLALFYKDMPSAQEFAKQLATAAAKQFEADADNVKQLLPSFFKE